MRTGVLQQFCFGHGKFEIPMGDTMKTEVWNKLYEINGEVLYEDHYLRAKNDIEELF